MGRQAWQDIPEVRERIDIRALARGRGGDRFGGLAIPVARGDSRGLAVATGQRWPPPVEGPVLQPLAEAEAPDGELAASLRSDRSPREPGVWQRFATNW